MIKKLLKMLSILLLIALLIAGVFIYSIYISVDKVTLTYESIASPKIPTSLNNAKIAFISDIKYNEYMNKERLTKMMEKLNGEKVDVVIFGGDIFSNADKKAPDSQSVREVTTILKNIKAPLGKFAVLGEEDLVNKDNKTKVTNILFNSDFEILTNANIHLRKESNSSINLIGIDSLINGNPKPESAMNKISDTSFNILISHCPDIVNDVDINIKYIDLILSGHSLGGQIYIPIIGPLHRIDGAKSYNRGTYDIDGTTLSVSNGLGTKDIDMRLFSPPEILIYRLVHSTK